MIEMLTDHWILIACVGILAAILICGRLAKQTDEDGWERHEPPFQKPMMRRKVKGAWEYRDMTPEESSQYAIDRSLSGF